MERRGLQRKVAEQGREFTRSRLAAEELGDLHEDDRESDAGYEAAHDGCGDVLDDVARSEEPEQDEPSARQQTDHGDKRHSFGRTEDQPHSRQSVADHDGGHGVYAHHKLGRARQQREYEDRQQGTVEAVDRREACDLRITHGDRYGDERHNNAGENVGSPVFQMDRCLHTSSSPGVRSCLASKMRILLNDPGCPMIADMFRNRSIPREEPYLVRL